MHYFSRQLGLLATLALLLVSSVPATAGQNNLEQALQNTLKEKTYHTTMTTPAGGTIEADVVNPGRMHMQMKGMEMIVIDQTVYMKQGGAWRKFPGADIMKTQTNPLQSLAASKGQYTVDDLGPKLFGGVPMHGYRVTNLKTKNVASVFVDGSTRIARIESGTTVLQMSKFGEPVTIAAPL